MTVRSWLQHHLNAVHVRCALYRASDRIARVWSGWCIRCFTGSPLRSLIEKYD